MVILIITGHKLCDINMEPINYNNNIYKFVNERNGYTAYRNREFGEIIVTHDGSVIEGVTLAYDWLRISDGGA